MHFIKLINLVGRLLQVQFVQQIVKLTKELQYGKVGATIMLHQC